MDLAINQNPRNVFSSTAVWAQTSKNLHPLLKQYRAIQCYRTPRLKHKPLLFHRTLLLLAMNRFLNLTDSEKKVYWWVICLIGLFSIIVGEFWEHGQVFLDNDIYSCSIWAVCVNEFDCQLCVLVRIIETNCLQFCLLYIYCMHNIGTQLRTRMHEWLLYCLM